VLTIELLHNGRHVATAGISGAHVLTAQVWFVNVREPHELHALLRGADWDTEPRVHLVWVEDEPLAIGDEVNVRVAESDDPIEAPRDSYPSEPFPPLVETADSLRERIAGLQRRIAAIEALVERNRDRPVHRSAEALRFDVSATGVGRALIGLPSRGSLGVNLTSFVRDDGLRRLSLEVGGVDDELDSFTWFTGHTLNVPADVRVNVLGGGDIDSPTRQSDRPPESDDQIAWLRGEIARVEARLRTRFPDDEA